MKIIFFAIAYQDTAISYSLYNDLMIELNKDHDVLVVAPEYTKGKIGMQEESGVKVLRVKTLPLFNVGKVKKGIANILLPYQYRRALSKHKVKMDFDLVIMPTPPITLIGLAKKIKKLSNAKLYLILRDIFPQNAVDLGFLSKGNLIYKRFRIQEKKCYQYSDYIGCMSPANIEYIKRHNPEVDVKKLHLLPNWSRLPEVAHSGNGDREVMEKYGLENKFILLYGGNIGLPQKVENLIDLATACQDLKEVLFLIIGNGTEREKIEGLIRNRKLDNVKLFQKLPKYEYVKIVEMAQIGLISLNEKFTIPNFPSKVLNYMAAKKPVLASLDCSTDFGEIIEDSGVGLWTYAGKTDKLKELLVYLIDHPEVRKQMGENGYAYLNKYLLPEQAAQTIISKVEAKQEKPVRQTKLKEFSIHSTNNYSGLH